MRWGLILLVIVFLVSSFTGLRAQVPEKVVTAEGMAAGSDLQARDEAINRALRRAIEQGVGSLVDSESMTQNYQLLDDKIYSHVKGYVKGYEIISDNEGADNIYRIKVEAVVALGLLNKDLRALNIIKEKKGNPRVMVLMREFVDGLDRPSELVQTEMEKIFLAKGFPVVDQSQMEMIKERDVALSYTNPKKAAVLGRQFGAEVVIVGQAESNLAESSMPYGVQVFAYTADITAKAIKTDTAAVMAVDSASGTERGSGRIPTANKALASAGRKMAGTMMYRIVEQWRSEVFNTVSIQLVIDNMQPADVDILKQDLYAIRGVVEVNERSLRNGVLIMDITVDGAIWQDFRKRLMNLPDIKFRFIAKSENKIELSKVPFAFNIDG